MSREDKETIAMCLDSEIKAFERDIAGTGPKRDHFGSKQFDVREAHLWRLVSARRAIDAIRPA